MGLFRRTGKGTEETVPANPHYHGDVSREASRFALSADARLPKHVGSLPIQAQIASAGKGNNVHEIWFGEGEPDSGIGPVVQLEAFAHITGSVGIRAEVFGGLVPAYATEYYSGEVSFPPSRGQEARYSEIMVEAATTALTQAGIAR